VPGIANLMATTDPVSEAEIESALRDDPDHAIELLGTFYQKQIVQYIKRVTWSRLKPDELMVAYQDTMLALIRKVREDGFDPSRPMRIVFAIASNKGLDLLRARRHRMSTSLDLLIDSVAASLKDTETGFRWQLLSPAERKEFREIVLASVRELPERQQIVARCYIDCFERVLQEDSYRPLAEAVSCVTGKQESLANVKSAWHVAKRKIASALTRRGYNIIPVE
jgi:DNA-directed RNA polymerase specialized sigma24 family protein